MNTQSEPRRPWGSAVATVLTFLALGPPLGAMTFVLLMTIAPGLGFMTVPDDKSVADVLAGSFAVMLFALPLSYLLGGIQAGLTGLLLAVYGWFKGRPSFLIVSAVAILVFALSYAANFGGLLSDSERIQIAMFLTHLVATLLCWLIARTYWRMAQ